nr:immunoglobulin heavy chain junction region [Mus musculus]MBK4195904.1 immunoglobulin heavy chain junction region [Mus musculus]MBK4195905.1 immunoglobulin heavy chain junction region [Mus musculus]MBK4196840.1 immunoglobulin heavy chain junction region [Mus musculus]MBK4196841.1 immunoglobulin heavy chain junction region [Mus musculus]
CARGFFAYW